MGPEGEPVAADADALAGDVAGGVRGEERDEGGTVLGSAESLALAQEVRQRRALLPLLDVGREGGDRLGHRRGGDGDHGVDGDP